MLFIPFSVIFLVIFTLVDLHKKKFHFLKRFLLVDGVILLCYLILLGLNIYISRPPSAEKLTENYFEHKEELVSLNVRILSHQKKGLERVDNSWTRPDNLKRIGLDQEDIEDYRSNFKKLNVPRGFYAYPDQIVYVVYAYGLSVSGTSRGYLYSKKQPKNFFKKNCGHSERPLKKIDDFSGCEGYATSYTIYQQIDENWYIFEDYED